MHQHTHGDYGSVANALPFLTLSSPHISIVKLLTHTLFRHKKVWVHGIKTQISS